MTFLRMPALKSQELTLSEQARRLGAFFVLDPSISCAGLADGAEVTTCPNALAIEYPGIGTNGGKVVLTGTGLHLNRTNARNGRPSVDTALGAATSQLRTVDQSPVKGADSGGLPAWDANWGASSWTIVLAIQFLAASPDGTYSGGVVIGKTGTNSSAVLGFSVPAAGHPNSFWPGALTGEVGYIDWPTSPPTDVMVVSLSYDGARLRWTVNGQDPTTADGVAVALNILTPGFGLEPAFAGLGWPPSRIYWLGIFPSALPRAAIRKLGRSLASELSLSDIPLLCVYGDSITAGLDLSAMASWAGSTVYVNGDLRKNGGKNYVCVTGGTSAGSGGPSGTGLTIADNTCTWAFIGTNNEFANVPNWPLVAMAQCLAAGKRGTMDNQGEAGSQTTWWLGQAHQKLVERRVQIGRRMIGIVEGGIVDIAAAHASASTILANRLQLILAMAEEGYSPIFVCTLIAAGLSGSDETTRLAVNAATLTLGTSYPSIPVIPVDLASVQGVTYADSNPAVHPDEAGDVLLGSYFAPYLSPWLT